MQVIIIIFFFFFYVLKEPRLSQRWGKRIGQTKFIVIVVAVSCTLLGSLYSSIPSTKIQNLRSGRIKLVYSVNYNLIHRVRKKRVIKLIRVLDSALIGWWKVAPEVGIIVPATEKIGEISQTFSYLSYLLSLSHAWIDQRIYPSYLSFYRIYLSYPALYLICCRYLIHSMGETEKKRWLYGWETSSSLGSFRV